MYGTRTMRWTLKQIYEWKCPSNKHATAILLARSIYEFIWCWWWWWWRWLWFPVKCTHERHGETTIAEKWKKKLSCKSDWHFMHLNEHVPHHRMFNYINIYLYIMVRGGDLAERKQKEKPFTFNRIFPMHNNNNKCVPFSCIKITNERQLTIKIKNNNNNKR